jgi:hypothetical protein
MEKPRERVNVLQQTADAFYEAATREIRRLNRMLLQPPKLSGRNPKLKWTKLARARKVREYRARGESFAQIGARLGFTRQRAQQILKWLENQEQRNQH